MKIQLLPIAVLALLISCTNKAEVETSGIVSLERDKMLEAVVLSNPQEVEMPEMLNPANFSVVHDSLLFVTNQQNMENLAPVEMFKFDHDGSLLATYKFDRFVNSISITKDEKYLYCGSRKSVSEVPCLLRYELR